MSDIMDRLSEALSDRYRIVSELGEGGMAIVFLADDLKHNRRVAIKVLKPELAAVVGKDRFFAEIETTAQLQHPNILPLFDSGEAGGLLFFAMPYVEGETLADWLAREHQLPVDTALDIARKLAAALEYAHRRGVVHRDVKPANVLISSGEPLIADFGIALAVSQAGNGRITETGLSLGTPHYMSPEQASGDRSLDPRSDIYALGCVLYEMLTGDPPFPGSTAQAVLARILTTAPTRVATARPTVPLHVDAVIARALEKLPADRFATAGDFRKALDEPSFRHDVATAAVTAPTVPTAAPQRRSRAVPVLGGLLAGAVAIAAWGWLRPEPMAPVQRFRLDVEVGDIPGRDLVISPDGSRVVYAGPDRQLYVQPLNSLDGLPIPGAEGARGLFFSPDGASVGFLTGPYNADRIHVVALSGGSPIPVGNAGGSVVSAGGATWSDDGYVYYMDDSGPRNALVRAPAQGGAAELVLDDVDVAFPASIPGVTDRILVTVRGVGEGGASASTGSQPDLSSWVGMLDTGTARIQPIAGLENVRDAQYAGGFIFGVTTDQILIAARFDPAAGRLTSPPVSLADRVDNNDYAVSPAGILVYFTIGSLSGGGLGETPGWIGRDGSPSIVNERLGANVDDFDDIRISADGRYLALEIQRNPDGSPEEEHRILIYDLEQEIPYQLTFEGRFNRIPRWLPDGRVAYYSDQGGRDGIWAQPWDRSGSESVLFETDHRIHGFDVSPVRGGPMAVDMSARNDSSDFMQGIYLVGDGDDAPRPFVASRFVEWAPAVSPDGRWIAYTSNESGRQEVYVRRFPEGGRPWPIANEASRAPAWGPGGDEILYIANDGVMAASLEITDAVRVTSRSLLLENRLNSSRYEFTRDAGAGYDIAEDGRIVVVFERTAQAQTAADGAELPIVVLNVFEELRQRLGEAGGR